MSWDPSLWQIFPSAPLDPRSLALYNADADPDTAKELYYLLARYSLLPWTTIADVAANTVDYRFPTVKPIVLRTWTSRDATGFASSGGLSGDVTFNYLELSTLETDGMWRDVGIAIDSAIFEPDRACEVLQAVAIDGQPAFRAVDMGTVIELFARHWRAKG